MHPTAQLQEQAAAAINATEQARRTGCQDALDKAKAREATARFFASQAITRAATQREADRLHAIGAGGREDERQASAHFYTR